MCMLTGDEAPERLSDGFAAVLTLLRHRCEPRCRFDRAFGAQAYGTSKGIERRNQLAGSEWLMRLG